MTTHELLTKLQKNLDAAIVEDGLGNEALCTLHLGYMHGLLIVHKEKLEKLDPPERKS